MKLKKIFLLKRWRETGEKKSPRSSRSLSNMIKRKYRAADTTQSEDSTSSSAGEDALWRVEYILANGPPRDEDWWESASASSCDGSQEEGHQEKELNGDGGKRFRNCGLEAWRQVQQAWRARDPSHTKTQSSKPRPSIKRDLVKSLSGCRQFELPQQLPLKDLISAYNDVWNGSD